MSIRIRQSMRRQLALANVKPRLRMTSLYYLANRYNGLVAGTGNKTELAIGYFTKYGDGGVDVLPLGDLNKSAVRGLARALGVPEAVIKPRRPVSGKARPTRRRLVSPTTSPTEPWLPCRRREQGTHTPGYDGPRLGARCGIRAQAPSHSDVSADTVDVISRW